MDLPGRLNRWRSEAIAILLTITGMVPCSRAADLNDSFAGAIILRGVTNVSASNVGATAEPGEPFHVNEQPAHSLWWRWTATSTATFSLSTSNSSFDTLLAVYTGSALSNLAPVISNDDFDSGVLWSRVFFRAHAGETFYVAVDGLGGETGTIQLGINPVIKPMRSWEAVSPQDGTVLYSSNYSGKVLLIDFWETICGTCVEELPDLVNLHDDYQGQGFSLIGLATDTKAGVVTSFLAGRGVNYPIAMNNPVAERSVTGTVGNLGYPEKYLVDREGQVVARYPGANPISLYTSAVRALVRPPPNVRVEITRSGSSVRISWPGNETGYEVQSIGQLPGTSWIRVNGPVQQSNGRNVVTVPVGDDTQFFRLQKL